ncbi:hydroxysqualene dehydroxylase HpnE [soil metagenome]
MKVAVIGGGWAGLAAAIEATQRGHAVTLFEMAAQLGGRSRGVESGESSLDNGQHILIGAYTETLRLMRTVGVDVEAAFLRTPLRITYPEGAGLQLEHGAAIPAFARAVLRHGAWSWRDRLALLAVCAGWSLRGFRCDPALTVATLAAKVPAAVRNDLIDPLCVAALNTPAADASASVFLRVLKDALFAGPGSADLLLPRISLSDVLPSPAERWLQEAGSTLELSHRVQRLQADGAGWEVDGQRFDAVVLATTPTEAARLAEPIAPLWSATAAALRYEPIVTLYLHSEGSTLPEPMLALHADDDAPAQFVFDRGQLGGPRGLLAFVISGAQPWVDRGMEATLHATLAQAQATLGAYLRAPLQELRTLTEKRATFRCTPGLPRAAMPVAAGLFAAGDHVEGPYPATLEGAVRSGIAAARAIG